VENVLMEHPDVLECAVTGVPDEARGQKIKATVVLSEGVEATKEKEREIKKFANERLAEYKHISILELVTQMPKTISGKIRRVELRKEEK
jgi:acetyl-CoA synthetase